MRRLWDWAITILVVALILYLALSGVLAFPFPF